MSNSSASVCSASADDSFGPVVRNCRNGFDFTLTFEQSLFTILPACLLLLIAPFRLQRLWKGPLKVTGNALRLSKQLAIAILAILQLALVGIWTSQNAAGRLRTVSIAASSVSFVASLVVGGLSYIEHSKSLRPSSILNTYTLASLVLDGAILRTMWLSHLSVALCAVFTASFAVKALLVILEAQAKTPCPAGGRVYSPEQTSGIYSRGLFWWLTPLLVTGFRRLLKPLDLFALDESMSAALLNKRFWACWNKPTSSSSSSHRLSDVSSRQNSYRLVWACVRTLKWQLLAVVPARVCLLAFTICQPLVLNRFLDFLQDPSESVNHGYGRIGAYGLVYLGMAVTSSFYWHQQFQSVAMLRGFLVASIYSKTMEVSVSSGDDSAAVTLMSTDVDAIIRACREVHEFWANAIQVAVATWILGTHIGYAAAAPIVVSVITLAATIATAPAAQKYQVSWVEGVQKRIGVTSAMLGHVKSIKMSGLTQKLSQTISDLRQSEMKAAVPFRVFNAITSAIAQVPLMIAPVVAFAMYTTIASKTGETLNATKLFAALSLIILLTNPLFFMFEVVYDMSAALGCFRRIEKYLCQAPRAEYRSLPQYSMSGPSSSNNSAAGNEKEEPATVSIKVQSASLGWKTEGEPTTATLTNINFNIAAGQLNETIRKNIICFADFDETLYLRVLHACDIDKDLAQLSDGDQTIIGSKGAALSGGQKQRIALARAVYSRPQIALFDDVLSGLDNQTAKAVFRRLLSAEEGLLRTWGTTVVLATQSVALLSHADRIIALGDGKIVEMGTFDECREADGYVKSLLSAVVTDDNGEEAQLVTATDEDSLDTSTATKSKASEEEEDMRRQLGDWSVYSYYFGSVGMVLVGIMLFLQITWAFFSTFPTIWLKFWTDHNAEHPNQDSAYYLGAYAAFQVSGVLCFAVLIWFVLVPVASKSGFNLHQRLLTTVMHFSQDIGLIDRNLPLALVVSLASLFTCVGKALLIASASWYIAISFPALILVFYYIQRAYLRTSRQLRFLDLEEKAPVYTHFLETLSGLPTLRAHSLTGQSITHSHTLIDRSQRPFYLLLLTQQWLTLVLDLTTAALALLVVGLAVHFRATVSIGLTGVSLVQLISFTESLKLLIQFWTSLETSIGAVARIKNFAAETVDEVDDDNLARQLLPEPQPSAVLTQGWPHQGAIEFRNVSASYTQQATEKEPIKALDSIDLSIKAGEKVGIVGRTGSGKSSLLLALLRLLPLSSGTVTIDGVPTSSIPLLDLRAALIAITQEQFVLPGTVRENIDPFGTATTEAITSALTSLGLWDAIRDKGGLDGEFTESVLSHGQKQLFFLARTVLRRDAGRVVLLDEATSSVDAHTERMVQRLVRDEFRNHTVVAIAHRLETVADFDRVVVMDKGRVVEVGNPQSLLAQQKGGQFRKLWDASRRTDDRVG
ncbi:ABC transporter atnG [Colletotrichum spinosum]|uniref:ABC transporter atnG n=1 Tax=Colletotrichum spinosum TaxID=1347390 RepID=A0A4V3HTN9_9PEZI|nr:ABC transporter atnG [Colletotrichum spinosum]